jgi:phage shock protein A
MDQEEAIRDFLGDRPRADEISEWKAALEQRLQALQRERERADAATPSLLAKIEQLKRQIAALDQEHAITEFVEDSVRATLAMGAIVDEPHGISD